MKRNSIFKLFAATLWTCLKIIPGHIPIWILDLSSFQISYFFYLLHTRTKNLTENESWDLPKTIHWCCCYLTSFFSARKLCLIWLQSLKLCSFWFIAIYSSRPTQSQMNAITGQIILPMRILYMMDEVVTVVAHKKDR